MFKSSYNEEKISYKSTKPKNQKYFISYSFTKFPTVALFYYTHTIISTKIII